MNENIKESANINPGTRKKHFHFYKELWTNNSLQENYWNTEYVDDKITITER
jgi:hypothetical protein